MRPVLVAALDRFVGDEPGVAAAAQVAAGASPAGTFDASWYGTPMARRSSGVVPLGVKWKMNSWQSLTKRSLLIGL